MMAAPAQVVWNLWSALTGHRETAAPEVVVYDRSTHAAHDLDDPFFDDNVQIRMAETIAATGNKKTKNGH
jgi:hypothetical protein